MIKAQAIKIIILIIIGTAISARAQAEMTEIRVPDLIKNSKQYDQTVIAVEGEAIGDILGRKNGSWVNVSDAGIAIGVWFVGNLADQIKFLGDYDHRGDRVRITGIYNHSCKAHGGDADIHARTLNILVYGQTIKREIPFATLAVTLLLSFTGTILFVVDLRRRRQKALIKERPF